MSEQKKTSSDKDASKDKKPFDKVDVHVVVTPKRHVSGNDPYVKKVGKSLEGEVKKALEDAKPGGSKKQLESVEKTAKDAAKKIDPAKVDNVKVRVLGNVDGASIRKDTSARPEERK